MGVIGEPTDAERRVWQARDMIRALAMQWFGQGESHRFTVTTMRTGLVLSDPLDILRATVLVRRVASAQERAYACDARGAGWSWAEVAGVLGFAEWDEPEVLAFEHVAERGGRPGVRRESVSWRCTSCEQRVTDTGPFGSHPTDVESGHAEACARHRAEIAAWVERTGWGQ